MQSEQKRIRAGRVEEIDPTGGEWVYVDPGFSCSRRTCGLLTGTGETRVLTFGELTRELVGLARHPGPALHLVIEAPLSIAFNSAGNPAGRSIERRGSQVRYWYAGLGCAVLVASTHLVRALTDAVPAREIRLFEGFVSFKNRRIASDHCADVRRLEAVVHGQAGAGRIVTPDQLPVSRDHIVLSAFAVAGMDYGTPPVVEAGSQVATGSAGLDA